MNSLWECLAKLPSEDRETLLKTSKNPKNRVTKTKIGTETVQFTTISIAPPVGYNELVLETGWDDDE